jgi:hypothetical protein
MSVNQGPYGDQALNEIYAEFRVQNYGTKPLSLQHIYVEENEGNLIYISPAGLPLILEGESSATFEIQKEHFDAVDIPTGGRINAGVLETGFVDALDRRYPIPKAELDQLLDESLKLPTKRAVFARKEQPESKVVAFQTGHSAIIIRRSEKSSRTSRTFPFGFRSIAKRWTKFK